jgi:trk system potassium uptake protein TrkH
MPQPDSFTPKRQLINFQPLLYANGILLMILATGMVIPALVDYAYGNDDAFAFAKAAFLTSFMGAGLFLSNKAEASTLSLREAFLLTASTWSIMPAFAALPFVFSELGMSYTDAYFEAMSGLTTTGASVIADLDIAPPGILLWRSLLCGLGGMGVIVMAMAILPMLSIGGMQLFRTESSDRMRKVLPRSKQIAAVTCTVFLTLVTFCTIGYSFAGMPFFDAVNHAFTSVATGGFSTKNASFREYNSLGIELVAIAAMIAGSMPMLFYYQFYRGDVKVFLRSSQVRTFFMTALFFVVMLTIWRWQTSETDLLQSFRYTAFNTISVMTTTGFVSTDYDLWGPFAMAVLLVASFIGGCTGSTTGGVKIYRYQILFRYAQVALKQLLQPNGVYVVRYEGMSVPQETIMSVLNFFVIYILTLGILTIALSATGMDFLGAFSSIAMAIINMGIGMGPHVGPAGNFSHLNDVGTWIVSFAMLLGRLEFFTILVLFLPQFWRD